MNRILPVALIVATVLLVAAGSVRGTSSRAAATPEAAVQAMFNRVQAHDFNGAFTYIAKSSNLDLPAFYRDVNGKDGSLRTLSSLQKVDTHVVNESDSEWTNTKELRLIRAKSKGVDN